MITVAAALEHVRASVPPLRSERVKIGDALGLRLRESIVSPVDSPPFDKALLDGYAVIANDPSPTRKVTEQVIAGGVPHHAVEPGTTINVMTGAPVPDGADAIIKHEDVTYPDDTTIAVPESGVAVGTGILPRGAAFHVGEELFSAGRQLSPVDIALLAEIGRVEVETIPRPRVAVLSTGNELVEPGERVGPGQICNSNGPMLLALLEASRAAAVNLGIGRDDAEQLRQLMQRGLECDLLLVTGGVSAGVMDLVPAVLAELGVRQVFHKVRMKPGKPVWFGVYEEGDRRALVLGMPGNPVSTLVSFEIFVKPALQALASGEFASPQPHRGVLAGGIGHRGQRPTYYPCQIRFGERERGLPTVETLQWRGSADLAALTRANALAVLPEGDYQLEAGAEVDVLPLG